MPNTKSAKKALRQSLRRRVLNTRRKDAYKDAARNVRALATSGKKGDAAKLLPALYAALDKAAKINVIAKNKASRMKSRLTALAREK